MQPDICVRTFQLPYGEREYSSPGSTSLWLDYCGPGVNSHGTLLTLHMCRAFMILTRSIRFPIFKLAGAYCFTAAHMDLSLLRIAYCTQLPPVGRFILDGRGFRAQ